MTKSSSWIRGQLEKSIIVYVRETDEEVFILLGNKNVTQKTGRGLPFATCLSQQFSL